jgi:hypothetical protein
MDPSNEDNAVGGNQQQAQQTPDAARQQYQQAGRPHATMRQPMERQTSQQQYQQSESSPFPTTLNSRFDQPIPRTTNSRSPVRDNRMPYDPTRSPEQPFLSPQSRNLEPRFQQPPDRLHTMNQVMNGGELMTRSPIEQSPLPLYRNVNDDGSLEGTSFMPLSPGGGRSQQYSMTRGISSPGRREFVEPGGAPGEFRRRLTGESYSLGSDQGRTRRGSAEKLLQSVLDECESLIDGLAIQKKE